MAVLLLGDVAIGDGVSRHFLSMAMYKLQHGFKVDVGKFTVRNLVL